MESLDTEQYNDEQGIAIIGMAGRFPQARDLSEFWENLAAGRECISHFSEEELASWGVPADMLKDTHFVPARGMLEGADLFDAAFFGYSPGEAELLDPQQRLFLECAWQALENAGYDPSTYPGLVGVYAGLNMNTYYSYILWNMFKNPALRETIDTFQLMLANDKDYLTTRVSYKLNLRGPSINIQTACSTSLVAVHLACQSLLNGECDIALAGGVAVHASQRSGYAYQEGGIASPDGHCRTFDASAQGTLSGNGLGIVVLKRLVDALTDGDTIHAVIKGTACNNDGSLKIGYTAPSVQGQAAVIAEAQSMADVPVETIGYIEAHGTATPLGDPIEIAALTQAFRLHTAKKHFIPIGSVKTNLGHLGAAAGIAGLLKTVLALKHQTLPASLHFKEPNPQIDFANSPFYVNSERTVWKRQDAPLRAGVSSFGIGGTNAHLILEEAPAVPPTSPAQPWQLLVLSAKTASALDQACHNLAHYLQEESAINLADVACTLQVGRSRFNHRLALVCRDVADACQELSNPTSQRLLSLEEESINRPVAFLFPGQGSQYVRMGLELYQTEPLFRAELDRCAALLRPHLQKNILTILYPPDSELAEAAEQLAQTHITQPVLFAFEYALARLWEAWGIQPHAMLGHSIGEYVAACLAGVFSLADGLKLVCARGHLMQTLARGAMLAVQLEQPEIEQLLTASNNQAISLAAVNAPNQCTVSGPFEAIAAFAQLLEERTIEYRRLKTSHAFHSSMTEPILEAFGELVASIPLQAPQQRFISNLTGTWITAEQATDPHYWIRHLRQTVRFADGVQTLLREPDMLLLEVGPGRALSTFAKQQKQADHPPVTVSSVRRETETQSDIAFLLTGAGQLWLHGAKIAWQKRSPQERRQRIPLPTYPFERQRYWIEPGEPTDVSSVKQSSDLKKAEIADWFYVPLWKQSVLSDSSQAQDFSSQKATWLIFLDDCGLGAQLAHRLVQAEQRVIVVTPGSHYHRSTEGRYSLHPERREDYLALLTELQAQQQVPDKIIHLWNVTEASHVAPALAQIASFYSLLFLAQALGELYPSHPMYIGIISNGLQSVTGEEQLCAEKALLSGPCKVLPLEHPSIVCQSIDIQLSASAEWQSEMLIEQIIEESSRPAPTPVVAYRNRRRWIQTFEPVQLHRKAAGSSLLKEEGVYLITGGLGGIGLTLAEYLARTVRARLALVGRSPFPAKDAWEQWARTHDEQDPVCQTIRKLQALEMAGSSILVEQADVTQLEQMQALINRIDQRFGIIHGVIHAAGIAGGGVLQLKDQEIAARVLAAKVTGTRILEQVLKPYHLDFLILCSSLSSIRGGAGQIDYSAANAFLDAFAHSQVGQNGTYTCAINWDVWQEVGMAVHTPLPQDLKERRLHSLDMALTPTEGMDVFSRVLLSNQPQIIVSTTDFHPVPRVSPAPARIEKNPQEERKKSAHPRPLLTNVYVAPRNEDEQRIADIWGSVLSIDQVGIYDNFFDLGGHSLLATQVVSRLRTRLHVEFPLRKFLEQPTVAEVATSLPEIRSRSEMAQASRDAQGTQKEGEKRPPLIQARKKGDQPALFPLSFAQQRLWFLDQLEPGNIAYVITQALHMSGFLRFSSLARSIHAVIQRHDSLRTTFTLKDGQPAQVIAPELTLRFPIVDLSSLPEAARFAEAQALVNSEGQQSFDLASGPLMRTTLLYLEPCSVALLLSLHHIIVDDWSLNVLLREIFTLYEAYCQGKSSPLAPLPLQYTDFVLWQRQWLQGEILQAHSDYWKQQLRGALPVQLPVDHPRTLVQSNRGARLAFELSADLTRELQALSREQDVTLFMTLLTAFQFLLSRYTGQTDIVVGTDIANRTQVETEQLIGFFVNLLPLRTKMPGTATFRNILHQVREMVLDAYTHQDMPFDMLVDILQLERQSNQTPLIHVLFVLQNTPRNPLEFSSLKLSSFMGERTTSKFEVALFMWQGTDGLKGAITYKTELFNASTIQTMIERFVLLLKNIVSQLDKPINTFDISTEEEKTQKLEEKRRKTSARIDKLKMKKSEEIYSAMKNDLLL